MALLFIYSRKTNESQRKDVPLYKKANLNHTDYAYRDAVNRLKSMLSDSYSAVKQNTRRPGYESDDTDNVSVITVHAIPIWQHTHTHTITYKTFSSVFQPQGN